MMFISTRNSKTRKSKKRRGQALVEFALMLPLLMTLMAASIDFGYLLFNYVSLYNGLREASRFASVAGYSDTPQYYDCNAIRKQITDRAILAGIIPDNITVNYDNGDPSSASLGNCPVGGVGTLSGGNPMLNGYRIVIDINVSVPFLTPFFKTFAPGGMAVHLKAARTLFPHGL
jgi:hypothetical protein